MIHGTKGKAANIEGFKGCRDKGLKGEEKKIVSEEAGDPALYLTGVSDVGLAQ